MRNDDEQKVAGLNACRALFAKRRDDIRKIYVDEASIPALSDVLKWAAAERIGYRVIDDGGLERIAETVHHDGVCFLARPRPTPRAADLLSWAGRTAGPVTLVLLEDVKNPHNLGAILRVCAHFGVRAVLAAGATPGLSPAAMRTAEGGAEHVDLIPVQDGAGMVETLRPLKFSIVATSSHASVPLQQEPLPARSVLLFGSEGAGLSRRLLGKADRTVAIPGTGALESLNVATAASVILWEHWRAHKTTPTATSVSVTATTPPAESRRPRRRR